VEGKLATRGGRQARRTQRIGGRERTLPELCATCDGYTLHAGLLEAIKEELGSDVTVRFVAKVSRYLRRFGLVEDRDGRYFTTPTGEALLEADPPDPLIEALFVRVAGFASLLCHMANGASDLPALVKAMTPYCQDRSPKSLDDYLTWWAAQTCLTTDRRVVTDLGRAWVERLPADLEVPALAKPLTGAAVADLGEPDEIVLAYPTFTAVFDAMRAADPGFVLDREHARAVHVAWTFHARKRFAILSGLSGTGKTQILLRMARAVCDKLGLDPDKHIALVPVLPDWRDPTGLLGYFNALHAEATFQPEPALRLVIAASRSPGKPFFLLLDEMNLGRVERYFAPFLSAMEVEKSRLHLRAGDEPVNFVPPSIAWPANLRIGGTQHGQHGRDDLPV
jgi:5-methylcytosine-specific restriction enzyme B